MIRPKLENSVLFVTVALIVLMLNSFIKRGGSQKPEVQMDTTELTSDTIHVIEIEVYEEEEMSYKDSLRNYIKDTNISHPDIVYAQAVLESGSFTSDLYITNNNLFGMKPAKQRPYTYKGVRKGYAHYSNWKQSVLDYALFQSAYMRGLTREQYLGYLQRNYAADQNYTRKLQAIISKEDSENWN